MKTLHVASALLLTLVLASPFAAAEALAQTEPREWEPITQERLQNPEDGDWLSYRRTGKCSFIPARLVGAS